MNFKQDPRFKKELEKLGHKYKNLGEDMVRVIYHLNQEESTITLIEIYVKNQKSNEDAKRWREYA